MEGAVEVGRGTDWRVGGAGGRVVWYTLTMLTLGAHIHPAPVPIQDGKCKCKCRRRRCRLERGWDGSWVAPACID